MCRTATFSSVTALLAAAVLTIPAASAQALNLKPEWRRIGNTSLSLGLPSPAGGPAVRVWYADNGRTLFVRTASGQVWRTEDGEKWERSSGTEPPVLQRPAIPNSPEPGAQTSVDPLQMSRVFAAGSFAWRSDDGGAHWTNLSALRGASILGGPLADIAASPLNGEEIVVAGSTGVWRSADSGASWAGLNENLPNLPVSRLLRVADAGQTTRIQLLDGSEAVWQAGDRFGWRIAEDSVLSTENSLKAAASPALGAGSVTAAVRSGDVVYAGSSGGRIVVSQDRGRSWRESPGVAGTGSIVRIFSDPKDPRFAIALSASRDAGRVLRTVNSGVFWDDISSNLPAGQVHGVWADRLTGAVYIASDGGVFMTYTDPVAASPPTPWSVIRPEPARDVMLDGTGNQLYVALESLGVYAILAPHRARDPRVVSAGDRILRAAAPGSLLSVIGTKVESARADDKTASVLAASDNESQIQLPYDLAGSSVVVSMTSGSGRIQLGLPVSATSPSIFLDADGNPLITNADTGLVLDASAPARSNSRIQLLATGLGKVSPEWMPGLPAPLQDPPKVLAPVRAWLDRAPVEVTRATLAPGYTGLYVIELQLPSLVNRGQAELYIEAGAASSNRVQIWLEP